MLGDILVQLVQDLWWKIVDIEFNLIITLFHIRKSIIEKVLWVHTDKFGKLSWMSFVAYIILFGERWLIRCESSVFSSILRSGTSSTFLTAFFL